MTSAIKATEIKQEASVTKVDLTIKTVLYLSLNQI
jgi:hypothetical protein